MLTLQRNRLMTGWPVGGSEKGSLERLQVVLMRSDDLYVTLKLLYICIN